MAPSTAEQLAALEARLVAVLAPYEDRLEWATIYGNRALRRKGASAHDWFAFVKPASRHVGFFLLPITQWPDLVEPLSPALRKRLTGKATFTFSAIDETELVELEALVAHAFERYTE
jgi:hypothetical protein